MLKRRSKKDCFKFDHGTYSYSWKDARGQKFNRLVSGAALRGLSDQHKAALITSPNDKMRREAAASLCRLGSAEGVKILVELLNSRRSFEYNEREGIVSILLNDGGAQGSSELAKLFSDEKDEGVKLRMLLALPADREPECIAVSPSWRSVLAQDLPLLAIVLLGVFLGRQLDVLWLAVWFRRNRIQLCGEHWRQAQPCKKLSNVTMLQKRDRI